MDTKLNIPKTIHVGCQKRDDTYTGQLAYVIYTDEKGKKRKETSWEGWRDKSIDAIDYDNVPTSGFVLNKGVGGARQSWGYNTRNEYIRVYDPRGFEFEISVSNLLFILQECTSIKGKGIEGEFVYSWDGTELVLLPVDCEEYVASTEFTKFKSMKIAKKDMTEGCVYKNKDMQTLVYIGRETVRELDKLYMWNADYTEELCNPPATKLHVFFNVTDNCFTFERGFTKLSVKVSKDPYPEFATLYTKLMNSKYCSMLLGGTLSKIKAPKVYSGKFLIKLKNGNFITKQVCHSNYHGGTVDYKESSGEIPYSDLHKMISKDTLKKLITTHYHSPYDRNNLAITESTLNEIYPNCELFTIEYEFESGQTEGLYTYVKRCKN